MKKMLHTGLRTTVSVVLFLLPAMLSSSIVFSQGTWSSLTNVAPHGNGGVMLLLTDGTILCKTDAGGSGQGTLWDRLTPDSHGSYKNGTWTTTAAMANDRLYFSSEVLRDGRVYVAGGEYGAGGSSAEVYNPLTNAWSTAATSAGSPSLSDCNSELLPDGRVLEAIQSGTTTGNYIYNATTNTTATAGSCFGSHDEAAWLKLPDSSILQVDIYSTNSERYIPSSNTWVHDATVPVQLYDPYGLEAGGALLLPNGTGFFIGATGHTAIYTPSGTTSPGSWTAGPNIPNSYGTPDAPCAMMVNGKVLVCASPLPRSANHFPDSTSFYEYDYVANSFTLVSTPFGGSIMSGWPSFISNMLVLPDGNVLYSYQGGGYYLYTPSGSAIAAGQPSIAAVARLNCDTFMATGTLFNGISEGSSYGDDWQNASNYPMIRLTSGSNVSYSRVYSWNSTGVRRGFAADTVYFVLPSGLAAGSYSLQVVANGISSSNYSLNTSLTITPATPTVCVGNTTSLTDAWGGGTWTSGSPSVATIGSSSGIVTGVSAGLAVITYNLSGCTSTETITVNGAPSAITGSTTVCPGSTSVLSSATGGGTWTSSSTGVATIGSSTGVVTGITNGTSNITYTVSGCTASVPVTVSTVAAIAGTSSVCSGSTTALSDATAGGTWSSSNPAIATVGSAGVVTGVALGTDTISYTLGAGCYASQTVTVAAGPAAISGPSSVCTGSGATLSSSPGGGTWSSSNSSVVSVGSSGAITGISTGSAGITYSLSGGCYAATSVTVSAGPSAISGSTFVCSGSATTSTLSATPAGGIWTSSNTSVATIGSISGIVTGASAGMSNITYTLSGGCNSATVVTVNTLAPITGMSGGCTGMADTFADATTGGSWSVSNSSIASIGSSSGILLPVAAGCVTVSYAAGGCYTTYPGVCAISSPSPLSGPSSVCAGSSVTLSDLATGGTWTSSNPAVATVTTLTLASATVTGISSGTAIISYNIGACAVTMIVTVMASPAITGSTSVCVSGTSLLSAVPSGGTWVSSNNAVASIGSVSGVVSGVTVGTAIIIYTPLAGCSSSVTVTVGTSPAAITGTLNVCAGASTTLSNAGTGVWSSGNPLIALVNSLTGVVTGLAAGSATITFTSGCGFVRAIVTVNPAPNTTSFVLSATSPCIGGASIVTITSATLAPGNYAVTYGLAGANNFTGNTATLIMGTATGTFTVPPPLLTATGNTSITINSLVNSSGCSATLSTGNTTGISVNSLPAAYSLTGGGVYCAGGAGVSVGLSGSSAGTSYQLFASGSPVGATVTGTGGAISFGLQTVTGTYTASALSSAMCPAMMSGSVTVTTNPLPTAYSVTGGGGYCSGGTGVAVGLSGSDAGVSYQLYNGGVAVGSAISGTGSALIFGTFSIAGIYTVVGTNVVTGCVSQMAGNASIVINTPPAPVAMTGGGGYCIGGAGLQVGLVGSAVGVNYQLYLAGSPVGSPFAGIGSSLNFGLQTSAGVYTAIATNATTGCSTNMSGSVTVIIYTLPNAYSVTGGGSFCSGGAGVSVGLSNSDVGVQYHLYRGGSPLVGMSLNGTGAALNFGLQATAGTYTVVAANMVTGCSNNMSGSVTVGANALPNTYSVTGGGSYCSGAAGAAVGLSSSDVGINYQLYLGGLAIGTAVPGTGIAISFGLQSAAGTYTVVATNATTSCVANMTGNATITISPLPGVSTVTGGGSYCSGGAGVVVGLATSSYGINYQLYRGGMSMGTIAAGTGGGISFGLQTMAGIYTAVATSTITGCISTMSGYATVVINSLPNVYGITGGGSYCSGGSGVHIGLSSSDAGISYQLYNGSLPSAGALTGTGAALDFGLRTTTGLYTVVATNNTTGCSTVMSGSASIAVNPLPPAYTVTGGGAYCSGGIGVHVGLSSSVAGINYRLYLGSSPVSSAITGTGIAIDFGLQMAAGVYTVVAVNNTTGCNSNMSGSATIVVNSLPMVFTMTGGGAYCAGGTAPAIGLSGSSSGVNYQLYVGASTIGATHNGTGASINFGAQTTAGNYTVIATNTTTGCTTNMSGTATVSVDPLPIVYAITGGGSYCSGGAGVGIGLSNSQSGINYRLFHGASGVGGAVAGTGGSISFGLQTVAGVYSIIATDATTGCTSSMNGSATIVINPLPTAVTVTGGGTYCAGGTGMHVGLSASVSGTNYQLYLGGSPVGSAVPGTGSALDFGLQTGAGVYTASAINVLTGCTSAMSGSATINIGMAPTMYSVTGGGSFCAGASGLHVGLSGSDAGTSYILYRNGTPVGSSFAGTGSSIDFGLETIAGTYAVIATTSSGCSETMNGSALLTVNPLPVSYNVTGGGGYCTGGAGVHVGLSHSDAGVNYQLMRGASAIGSPMAGTGSALDFGLQTSAGAYTVTGTNATTGCTGNMAGSVSVSVTTAPTTYSVTGGGSYCAGGTGVNIGLSGSQIGTSYQLYLGGATSGTSVNGTGVALSFGTKTAAGSYTVVATVTGSTCTGNMSGSVSVSVTPIPATDTVTGGGTTCAAGPGPHIGLNASSVGVTYQLYRTLLPVGSPIAGTGSTIDFGPFATAGSYTVIASTSGASCTASMHGSATIYIATSPAPVALTGGGGYCSGGAGVSVGLAGSVIGVNYQLYLGGIPVGSPVTGVGSAFSFGLQTSAGVYTATGAYAGTSCSSNMTGSKTVTVYPLAPVDTITGGGAYCAGSTGVSIGLNTSSTGVNYKLLHSGLSVSSMAGTGSAINFGLVTTSGTYSVVAIESSTGCADNMSGTTTVSVDPLPSVSGSIYTVAPSSSISLSASMSGGVWSSSNSAIMTIGSSSGTVTGVALGSAVATYTLPTGCYGVHTIYVTATGHRGNNSSVLQSSEINVLPNPSHGTFTVKGMLPITTEDVVIQVTNMLGQVVYAGNSAIRNGMLDETIRLPGALANGMYLLSIRSSDDYRMFHIVLEQ